jgi:cytochrome c553
MRFSSPRYGLSVALLLSWTTGGVSAWPFEENEKQSEKVWGILNQHCFSCHGQNHQKGGLRLDSASAAVVPGKPLASELYKRVTSRNTHEKMPPERKSLSDQEIETLKNWIESGAKWPKSNSTNFNIKQPRPWSFQPITRPSVPKVASDRVRTEIDSFILAKLEKEKIELSPEADRVTLIRRASLDLTGLLPTPSEVDQFLGDKREYAFEHLVDRLLGSPHFGEAWASTWLDLARYADSDGYEHDEIRPHAYHYRDWVIRSLNNDQPFDQFTIEQLAGDLLENPTEDQYLATGFHRQTMRHNTAEMFKDEFQMKTIKDRVNTTSSVWMGLTIGCAECHHHKSDPVSQSDYYRLFAFFHDAVEVDRQGKKSSHIPSLADSPQTTRIHLRGNFKSLGDRVEPGTLSELPAMKDHPKRATRLDLARWLVSESHPLTARVEVNRIWKQLFGQGLVSTLDDFGNRGQPPTHPDLLDWLSSEFRAQGWSRKKIIRLIMTSSTYRQSSRFRTDLATIDPGNRLWARQNRYRIDAEHIYDISHQVAGLLKLNHVGGPSFQPPLPTGLEKKLIQNNKLLETSKADERHRRGLYLQIQRTYPHPFRTVFDAPDGNASCAVRERGISSAQALYQMNDPVFRECTKAFADRIEKKDGTDEKRLEFAFRVCFGRYPDTEEKQIFLSVFDDSSLENTNTKWQLISRILYNMEAFMSRE